MTETSASALRKTPLHARHRDLGARMIAFGGWEMPLEYSGIADEHITVRTRAGVFDVSHMGQIEIAGRDALAAVQRVSCNDAAKLEVGRAQYSALLTRQGTFVDDLLVYQLADGHYLLVVNAANISKDFAWVSEHIKPAGDAVAVNTSARYALLAIQGPKAAEVLQQLTGVDLAAIRNYRFTTGEVAGVRSTISRTGYTGEDGFEVFVPPQHAAAVWNAILDVGRSVDLKPAGLGARDTLRLEAAMRLHGNDIDETTTVLEADLGWIVGWDKDDFIGAEALRRQKADGVSRRIVGFEMADKGIARPGYDVFVDGTRVGAVTSGTQTPFLKKAIGMAYVPANRTEPGTPIEVDIRGKRAAARIVSMPFYKRSRGGS